MKSIDDSSKTNNGSSMLVIMEDGDVHFLLQLRLHKEAIGPLDVLQVNSPEGRPKFLNDSNKLFRVFHINAQIDGVDICELLEEHGFALHHGLGGECAEVPETQNSRAVGDHGHHIRFVRVQIGQLWILLNFETGESNTGRVGKGKIFRVIHLLRRHYAKLPRLWVLMVGKCGTSKLF